MSTPFLNIHWFLDKVNMTGSRLQWYNGILLLLSFAGCRLLWGTYQSLRVYQDIWTAFQVPTTQSIASAISSQALKTDSAVHDIFVPKDGSVCLGDESCVAAQGEVLSYITHAGHIPWWLAAITLASNLVLNSLNFYWYGKMIKAVMSRFNDTPNPNIDRDAAHLDGPVLDAAEKLNQEILSAERNGATEEVEKKQKEVRFDKSASHRQAIATLASGKDASTTEATKRKN